jgi:hypothetical protein
MFCPLPGGELPHLFLGEVSAEVVSVADCPMARIHSNFLLFEESPFVNKQIRPYNL